MSIENVFLISYFAVMICIGVWTSRRGSGDREDFLLAGRTVGPGVTALRLQSSSMSGYTWLGAGSLGNVNGFYGMWYALGDLAGGIINLSILGRRMRKLSRILGAITSIGYLEHRFPSKWTRIIAVSIALFCIFFYAMAQFIAGGRGLEMVTGQPYALTLAAAIGVILVYTFLGGYLAVAYTDFMQAIVMLIGMMWVLIAALNYVGGFTAGNQGIAEINPNLLTMYGEDLQFEGQWGVILGALLIFSIGYMGWPHVNVSHMAMRKPSVARRAGAYSLAFNLLYVPPPYLIGLFALLIVPNLDDPELAVFAVADTVLPAFAVGIVMAAIMAAIMSTADALLLQAGTMASQDVIARFIRPNLTERGMVWVSRILIVVLGIIGYFVAAVEPPAVATIVIFATTVLGSAFVPVYVAAVWWKKANAVGAVSSMLAGTVSSVTWEMTGLTESAGLDPMVVGIVCSTLGLVIGTLLSQHVNPVPAHIQEAVDETSNTGRIPARMLTGQNHALASQTGDVEDLPKDTP